MNLSQSDDEVDELGTVLVSLISEDTEEDGKDDVVGNVSGILDNLISNQEDNSNILEAVRGQQESDSSSFNGITELRLDLVLRSA